ncbi:glycoside hydrolase family 15 protein [Streptomyces scabiei]|uniref:glycoside hydrolase family 15 protein n=1 Tax=Streptomyces scabiei TaxID=1930 RepID=UPI001B30A67F|nr:MULTISPECIES: glycoside hydrolase family 15 protein [Streptomyces]MBP5864518.1 glycoside hydrolase family 15 protein [Streptomyces sp. LBUM 1484]MBP5874823.1 glycoside hydrolase family 15 protein [Streptomyces sp. LBUM 1477]MBP5882580.1 glycoside hydrolase family 15 protein [Streptomyces sp. LBUM 1487]MBP5898643.1 glycoside hydrolase family 15 protein [Streptomyces sp. LBUM 1488]MDW8472100.1 glycoside hydrolase family 15 protein [Streptomyces scabiei]
MHPRIEDYALIGDHQTAALVNRHGSIDWLCLPRFDSAACFAALLGDQENGHWTLAPRGGGTCARRAYRHDSLVLDTEWETDEGAVRVTDLMPQRDRSPDVVRIVEGLSGRVTMRSTVRLRFDYGSAVPWMRRSDGHRVAVAGPDSVWLRSEPGVRSWSEDRATYAEFTVEPGEKVAFVLTWHPSHEPRPRLVDPHEALRSSLHDWRAWAERCRYDGPHRDLVVRSLITLKALTYAPTGGIVAAATISLPEEIGGVRNWDYRHCWLRDSTLTLGALLSCGYQEEAEAWRDWLLRAVAGDPADLQIMYGLAGERRIPEYDLPWLSGYEDSRPVRVGNDAVRQLQLDVYGEVIDSLFVSRRSGLPDKPDMWRMQCALMDYLRSAWRKPDEGLWEVRGPRRHFTHSKVMCWVAADRAVRTLEADPELTGGDLEGWRALRDEIHREVCDRGYDPERNTFTQSYGSRELDAALLLIPLMGFLPPDDPRVVGTVDAIRAELSHEGLVRRYGLDHRTAATTSVDGLPGGEGAFLVCSFWLADALHLTGRTAEARELFERLVGLANDVGLLAEEYDPVAGRQLGNFPQAFSHVGLVGTALALYGGQEAG